ncbi:hypothetical protein C8R44DRAFT_882737 [Mycena epipterygia]|nr:hypothetical protein C8R44DRAFT_882737 [Mycena epipterygia]
MLAAMRHAYAKKGAIALPLEGHLMKKDWKSMNETTFMKKYRNDVLALYDLLTAEEMVQEGSEDEMEQDE